MSPIPIRSDRSAWDSIDYPDLHAKDIENGSPKVHLPVASSGQIAIFDGTKWVAQDHTDIYVQETDPGAVGAGALWVDRSSGPPYALKVRNAGDSAWESVGGSSGTVTLDPHRVPVTDSDGNLITLATIRNDPLYGSEPDYPSLTIGTEEAAVWADGYLLNLISDAVQAPLNLGLQAYTYQPSVDMIRANGDVDAPGQVFNGDVLGEVNFYGKSDGAPLWSAQIQAAAIENFVEATYAGASRMVLRVRAVGEFSIIDAVEILGKKTKFKQDIEIDAAGAFYLGDPDTDGSWRIVRSGTDLVHQRRESGSWVTKQTITA